MQKRILLVDDEPRVLRSLTASLEDDYDITTTFSAIEAQLAINSGDQFDVVITDQEMPKMKGHDFLHWCQENTPKSKLFLLTGMPITGELKEKFSDIDSMSIFTKPWDIDALVDAFDDESNMASKEEASETKDKGTLVVIDPSTQYHKLYSTLVGKYVSKIEYVNKLPEVRKLSTVSAIIVALDDLEEKSKALLSSLNKRCPEANIIVSATPYTLNELQKAKQLPENITTIVKPFSLPRLVSHFKKIMAS